MLLQVIQDLMQHSIPNIQRKSMELLNSFLQQKEHTMVTDPALLGLSCLHKGHKYNFLCITFFNFVHLHYRRRFYFLDLFVLFGALSLS